MRRLARIGDFIGRPAWLGALLVVGTLLLYLPVVHHDFISGWDDDDYITANPHVRSGLTPANIAWAFKSFELSNWHPVTWLSHMLDCQLFDLNSAAHHYVNVILHGANAVLLFWLLQRATAALWRSWFVAAVFAVHPLNVETVAWAAQRKSLLSAFFSLLAIAAYGWYVQRGGWRRYSAIVAAFALALMSKPMAVTLPLLLLLFDYWPLGRLERLPASQRWTRLVTEKLPLLAMSAASSGLAEMAQGSGGSVMRLSLLPVSARLENSVISSVTYIGKILWPARLAAFYPLNLSPPLGTFIASGMILIGITALALFLRRARYVTVGWLLFLITITPVIGLVQVGFQGKADRYTYVPAIGLFIALAWGLDAVFVDIRMPSLVLPLSALACVTGLTLATARDLSYWQNGITLFAQARRAWGQPDLWLEQLYGNALFASGRTSEALLHYQESCAIQPKTEYCHYGIAHVLSVQGQFRAAIQEYQLALKYTANPTMALLCLTEMSEALLRLGEYDAAANALKQALILDPGNQAARQLREQAIHASGGGG